MSDLTPGTPGSTPSSASKNTRNTALFGMGAVLLGLGLAAGLMLHKVNDDGPAIDPSVAQQQFGASAPYQTNDRLASQQQPAIDSNRDRTSPSSETPTRTNRQRTVASNTSRTSRDTYDNLPPTAAGSTICANCGVVESVRAVQVEGQGSGVGAVTGGVLGGVVGNQMGKGSGNAAMTVLGAIGGGIAGNEIEKSRKRSTIYEVTVRMDDGNTRIFKRSEPTSTGTRVEVSGNGFHERGSVN